MAWRPLIADPDHRARITTVIDEIVAAAGIPAELDAAVDRALLFAYLGRDDAGDALIAAITRMTEAPHGPSLHGGAARVGWAVAHLAGGDHAEEVCAAIDRQVARAIADCDDGDLAGYGVYALERGDDALALAILGRLERRAPSRSPDDADVVAVLARFVRAGLTQAEPLLARTRADLRSIPPDLRVATALCAAGAPDEAVVIARTSADGGARAAHALNRLWQATDDEALATAARAGLDDALPRDPLVGLVLHASISDDEPLWDRLLLLDV